MKEQSLDSVRAPEIVAAEILADLVAARAVGGPRPRPFVTLAWAQSVDGSLALAPGRKLALSSAESLRVTHALRAAHDGILVGIGTVLADDPELTVRLVAGSSPRPVVLDSRLRTPEAARMLARARDGGRNALLAATEAAGSDRQAALEQQGARVLRLPAWANGWVDLGALLATLPSQRLERLMVEGGAKVLTSFLRAGLADFAVITVAPRILGGLSAVSALERGRPAELGALKSARVGADVILWGRLA